MKKGSINDSNLIKEKGFYKNGEKDGLWIEYTAPFSGQIKSTGIYKDGSKTGIWKTYIEHGNIIQRYDYDSNKYLPNQLNLYLSIAVAYPEKSREAGIQGTVVVNYSVENDCSIDSIMVINSVSKDCDDAVIDVVKQYGGLYKTYHQKYNIPCKPEKSVPFSVKFQFR
ncbi:MAG TPA: TonB family protein [Bacteroidia bacterium]|nr:TonB family protein [Bacteroidia bacterium]